MDPFQNTNFSDESFKPKQPVDIREILNKYIYHWPLFVIAMLIAFGSVFLYLRYATKIYNVKATILIKDEKQESVNSLIGMGLAKDSRALENEMEILQSKTLMKQVVQELDVNIVYKTKGVANATDIYGASPFRLFFENEDQIGSAYWTIDVTDTTYFLLIEELSGMKMRARFGTRVKTPFGFCRIEKTPQVRSYVGLTIHVFLETAETKTSAILSNMTLGQNSKQTSVLTISLKDEVSQRAKDILNSLIRVYSIASVEDKNRTVARSIKFLTDRLDYISGELREVEKQADDYRSANGITEMSGQAQLLQASVGENDKRLAEVDLELKAIAEVSRYISSSSVGDDPPFLNGLSDASLQSFAQQFAALQQRRDRLVETVPESNILVQTLDKEISRVKSNIRSSLNGMRSFLNKERSALSGKNDSYESVMSTIPVKERQLMNIERQRGIKETLYMALLQKKEEAELTSATTVADNRILEEAYGSAIPIKPEKGNIYLLALAFGMFTPIAYVFAKDALNFRVINLKDISERTSVPILGEVMYQEGAGAIVLDNNSRDAIAEQFRSIRTNMQYISGREKGSRVTLFTSSMSGEGKSFISSNVAAALAMAGRKTVILELDLRKPKIAKYLKLKNRTGLSNYFIGQIPKEEIILESGVHENLKVITSGPIPPNPAELLEQKGMDELIDWLKISFDEIIIDTPPIGLVTDALILARLADVSIYVIRHGVTLKSQVLAIEELHRAKKFPKLNLVHNGIKLMGRYGYGYGYGSTYGYGYGSGYGYGYYDKPALKKKKGLRMHPLLSDFLKRF